MATEATFVHEGCNVDYTPSGDVAAGTVVVQGTLVGVATRAIAANAKGALCVRGVFDFAKATGAGTDITAGAAVYWDDTNNVATTTSSGNTALGKAVAAASTSAATVRVKINF